MFKYLLNRKSKKCQNGPESSNQQETSQPAPVLDDASEEFLHQVLSDKGLSSTSPEISPDLDLADIDQANETLPQDTEKGKGKETHLKKEEKPGWFQLLRNNKENKKKFGLRPTQDTVTPKEAAQEEDELTKVLEDLDLSAKNNRAFFLSSKSSELVQKFTIVLKDLIHGVPTAHNDLVKLLNDSSGTLESMYKNLPDFIKKLVTQLPTKFKGHLAPELLAAAAEVPGLAKGPGINIKDLVAKPGAIYSLLRAIMNALKLRWPAFIGTNVLLSLALFVLLFVLWYCHKRGREERLEQEARTNGESRIEELDDDLMIEKH
ncbi:hypothetical protein GcC1_035025 [Golovinomyces cichoracearum]|uniref:Ring-like domain-containing protein n=1 Tax=Golovinomyces cichoracearum TaxID=62708 RepID=A0A420J166_9PEZI|nr:hypothetical protein GcC1_035025 [Golovinomyces cichoracearum]